MAAEQGFAAARFNLGAMYATGEGLPQDAAQALKWFRKAAEQGQVDAQINLGAMHAEGWGVLPRDAVKAYAWLNIGAEQGSEPAREMRDEVAAALSREELSRARQLAREYWTAYVEPFR